jgi:hypothetical protein
MPYCPELYESDEFFEKVARKMCELDGNPHHKNYNKYFKRIRALLPLMNEELKRVKYEYERDDPERW